MENSKPTPEEIAALLDERDRLLEEHRDAGSLDARKLDAYRDRKSRLLGRVARHLS